MTDEQMLALRKMIDTSERITIYNDGDVAKFVGRDSRPLTGPPGSLYVERRVKRDIARNSFGWCVVEPDGTVRA